MERVARPGVVQQNAEIFHEKSASLRDKAEESRSKALTVLLKNSRKMIKSSERRLGQILGKMKTQIGKEIHGVNGEVKETRAAKVRLLPQTKTRSQVRGQQGNGCPFLNDSARYMGVIEVL